MAALLAFNKPKAFGGELIIPRLRWLRIPP